MRTDSHSGSRLFLCTLSAVWLLPVPSALAHDIELPIAGRKLKIRTENGAQEQYVRFVARDQEEINVGHDPRQADSWLLVWGYGGEGGSSGRIELDRTKWAPWTSRDGERSGFKYRDKVGERGGVQKVLLMDGRIVLKIDGPNWPWEPSGTDESVWVHFGLEEESVCARFGGEVRRNRPGYFKAVHSLPPEECPIAVCGNAVLELGEDCDDGNLVADDGCSSSCEIDRCIGEPFDSTYAAIQDLVFDGHGCNDALCHGSVPGQGGLTLLADQSYDALLDVPSFVSMHLRVNPRQPRDSALYLKLLKAVDPDATTIAGGGMPVGRPPVSPELLEAVRLWIETGAPETGTVAGTETLLDGCFPEPGPIEVNPLPVPDPEDGVQLSMPSYALPPHSESEVCFAVYYDLSDTVPDEYESDDGEFFFVSDGGVRADPHSHHLVAMHSGFQADMSAHPSFGSWTCVGGARDGGSCDPAATDPCGGGICRSEIKPSVACIGYGPPGGPIAGNANDVGPPAVKGRGFYRRVPLRGLLYWNSHAFNLTETTHEMHAYRNLLYAKLREHETRTHVNSVYIYAAAGTPPYTRQTVCSSQEFERGTRVVSLTSHTHKRGEAFWIEDPDGNRIYENFTYADPVFQAFDPPLAFDSVDPEQRTIEYCATYNNGVKPDGSPDPSKVRRLSMSPRNSFGRCKPTACTDGKIGFPCDGEDDHASCDSVPGAGDGVCDACPITAGVSTEDEMFIPIWSSYQVDVE